MATIFDDQRLDLGQFPHLMPPWLSIAPRQLPPASPTSRGLQLDDTLTLRGGNQRPLAPGMPRLSPVLPLRFPLRRRWLRMRMLRTGRQRRVLRRLLQRPHFRFQFRQLRQQDPNDGLRLRRLASDHLFRNQVQRHAPSVAEIRRLDQTTFPTRQSPPRKRLPSTTTTE